MTKKPKLDAATLNVVKRVLAMPPKRNEELKVGRDATAQEKKTRKPKGRASSSKQRDA